MKQNTARIVFAFAAALTVAVFIPHAANAQSATNGLGNVLTNVAYTTHFSLVLSVVSYIIGIALGFSALLKFKNWADGQPAFADGLWRMVGSACMTGMPSFINTVIDSYFGSWNNAATASGNYNRISGLTANYSTNGGWVGLDQVMVNFVVDIYNPAKLVTGWAAYIVGIACMITGVYRLAQAGQAATGRAPSIKGTVAYIGGGALMLAGSQLMDAITTSLFGNASPGQFSSLYYSVPGVDQTAVNNATTALFAFVEIIGWVAFIRGIYLLVKIAQAGGDRTHAHAFTHIVFGAAAVNMYAVVKVVQSSMGVQLVN